MLFVQRFHDVFDQVARLFVISGFASDFKSRPNRRSPLSES